MNGRTYAYLDLAALPAVGAVLLDPRPAFVFRGDGTGLLFANAEGTEFLGEKDMGAVLERRFAAGSSLARQLARFAKLLPADRMRLEMLRFSFGVRQKTLAAACQRLNLADGSAALFAIGMAPDARQSLVTRAETLTDLIAGRGRLAAILNADGRVLGASGGFSSLAPVSDTIDELIEAAAGANARLIKRPIELGKVVRPAGVARFEIGEDSFFLLIVGPADEEPVAAKPRAAPARTAREHFESEFDIARELDQAGTTPAPVAPRVAAPPAKPVLPTWKPVPTTAKTRPAAPIEAPLPPPLRSEAPAEEAPFDGAGAFEAETPAASADPDDVARVSVEQGLRLVVTQDETPADRSPPRPEPEPARPSNVVRLPGIVAPPRAVPADQLTGAEHDAFRRIAEALGAQHEAADKRAHEIASADATPAMPVEPAPPAPAASEPSAAETRILDRLPIGLVVFRDRKTIFANRTLLEMLGYESLAGFTAAGGADTLFPGTDADWSKPGFAAPEGQLAARRRDGGTLPVEARLHTVPWGRSSAMMLSLRELPKPAAAEARPNALIAEIAAGQNRVDELETILDTATDGVIVIDGRGRIENVNRSAEALFGIEASQVLGHAFTDLLAEESRKAALDYLDGLASNGVASVLNDGREVIGKVPQGGLIPLFMTMGRLGDTGKFCAVLRDITQWKNAEEELVAARRAAEQANQQKSDFLAKISHEIRTPLNAIIGFSEVMIEERFGAIGNDRYRDYLRDIHVSGAHLMSLINDLLDLSKIEAGKLDLAFESVAVNAIIQECVALMQPQANRQRIIIRTSLSASVPNVVADPRSLRQILLNLLSNAVKFTQAGGQVIVSTALEDRGEVVIRVRDTGIGMSEKDIETALKPFRQLSTTGRGRGEGTGLGLPLTKALVEANRATFSIDSAVDQGTLVRVIFPTTRVLAG